MRCLHRRSTLPKRTDFHPPNIQFTPLQVRPPRVAILQGRAERLFKLPHGIESGSRETQLHSRIIRPAVAMTRYRNTIIIARSQAQKSLHIIIYISEQQYDPEA